MKQLFRKWLLVLAMMAGGASSAAAQTESDYFRVTKKPGALDEFSRCYTTFDEALAGAADGDLITLLKDYTATGRVEINKSITLDLNDKSYTGAFQGDLISVKSGATLTLVSTDSDPDKTGTIENNNENSAYGVKVESGGTLFAHGGSIVSSNATAIYNRGTADIDGCDLSGLICIDSNGTATVSNTSISGTNRGILVFGGTTTIGSGVSISGYSGDSNYGIYYGDGTVILKALPTFNDQGNGYKADIYIWGGHSLTFGEGTFSAENPKIKLLMRDNNGNTVTPATYTNAFTEGYAANVTDANGVIDPNDIFEWYDGNYTRGFVVNADGEVIFCPGVASVTVDDGGSTPTISYYATLDEALGAAKSEFDTHIGSTPAMVPKVTLFDDVNCGESQIKFGSDGYNCDLVLDLNGHTLSGNTEQLIYVFVDRTLTVEDSGNGGRIVNNGDYAIYNYGTLNLHGGTIGGHDTSIENYGTLNVSGGTIDVSDAHYGIENYGPLTLNGLPKFEHGSKTSVKDIFLKTSGKITFGAGTYEAPENPIVIVAPIEPPYTFTSGYGTYVRDADNNPIDPYRVFSYVGATSDYQVTFDELGGEATIYHGAADVELADDADNSKKLVMGKYCNVTLADRTITRDGTWNTLCLPFDVTLSGSPLEDFTVKELNASASSLDGNGQLTLKFTAVTDKIKAGKPYILRLPPTGYGPVKDPVLVFSGVTITSTEPEAVTFSNALGAPCQFVGQYSPFEINDGTATEGFHSNVNNIDEILFFAKGDATSSTVLGYSQSPRNLRPFRAHFWVPARDHDYSNGSGAVRSVTMNFGDGTDATGVVELKNSRIEELKSDDGWYSMDGRRLPGKPAQKGVYIHNGKKMIIK